MGEVWVDIKDYEGLYQVSNLGRVKSLDRIVQVNKYGKIINKKIKGTIMKPNKNQKGYEGVQLCKNGNIKAYRIHRLVATHFIKNNIKSNKAQVNHINGNKLDNSSQNLEWVTPSQNIKHAINMGLKKFQYGDEHFSRKEGYVSHLRKKVQCIETGETFDSLKDAGQFYNCNRNKIGMVCNGKRKSCGKINNKKLTWRFLNE